MARSRTIPSRTYAAGTYVESLDSFTKHDTSQITATFTVENWPNTDATVLRVSIRFDGDPMTFNAEFPGRPMGRTGPASSVSCSFPVPQVADERGNATKVTVASGTVTMEVLQALRTAITVEAEAA